MAVFEIVAEVNINYGNLGAPLYPIRNRPGWSGERVRDCQPVR